MPTPPSKTRRGQRDMSRAFEEWRFEVGSPDHGVRLDAFLAGHLRWRSRARIQDAIDGGAVTILPHRDPQRAMIGRLRPGTRVRRGQEVVVRLPSAQHEPGAGSYRWRADKLPVVCEDGELLAVNKPPHLNVYPTRRHRAGSLIELVHHMHQAHRRGSEPDTYPPTLCHRLDRETSGLVLFARTRAARAELSRQFEAREVEKTYLALVVGEVEPEAGRIDQALGPDDASPVEIKLCPRPDGRAAATRWRVARRLAGRTLLELAPETGRQHQLRVHCAAIGHPIVGDKLYFGGDDVFLRSLDGELASEDLAALGHDRQALHAWRLRLRHPATGEMTTLEAPLWPDLESLVEGAGEREG